MYVALMQSGFYTRELLLEFRYAVLNPHPSSTNARELRRKLGTIMDESQPARCSNTHNTNKHYIH